MAKIALYKGPPTSLGHWLTHLGICLVLSLRRGRIIRHSHAELVVDGQCYSASFRDGGVRGKMVDLSSGRWDVSDDLRLDDQEIKRRINSVLGRPYDVAGAGHWALHWLKPNPRKFYCFEFCAYALGLEQPENYEPETLSLTLRLNFYEHRTNG